MSMLAKRSPLLLLGENDRLTSVATISSPKVARVSVCLLRGLIVLLLQGMFRTSLPGGHSSQLHCFSPLDIESPVH